MTEFGDPLNGLSDAQLALFSDGLDAFEEDESEDSRLGPVFNNVSCVICHITPATGGSSPILETRFGRTINGHFDPLAELGGSLRQDFAVSDECAEIVPPEANVIAKRQTTPLFGLGLIEAIPDKTILAAAECRKPDGVTGRAAIITDVVTGAERVGRFGWKCQQATLLAFAGDAYVNEMGITSRLFPTENAPQGDAERLAECDTVADPEDDENDIDKFADFMQLLAPPPPVPLTAKSRYGQQLFHATGCVECHTPTMYTGNSPIPALSHKPVNLYSDLLLHDMGSLGDGIEQSAARQREMRTAPLWGLRASAPYLHDGRASTVTAAIQAHDGEARIARQRYNHLTKEQVEALVLFLESL